jgi:two-component system response regulator FlrC
VLQEGEVDRLGGKKPVKVNVRVIATTNRNLAEMVRRGQFREDLYFRLYGVRFEIPALSQRKADIGFLAHRFLERECERLGRSLQFSEGVIDEISQREWPGNVRELERAIERAAILSESGSIEWKDFEFAHAPRSENACASNANEAELQFVSFSSSKPIREMEKEIILNALEAHRGNRTHTAKALGMSLRTLRHKLKQYREDGETIEEARQAKLGKKDPLSLPTSTIEAASGAAKHG